MGVNSARAKMSKSKPTSKRHATPDTHTCTDSLAHLGIDAHIDQNALSYTHTDMKLFLVSGALKIHFLSTPSLDCPSL